MEYENEFLDLPDDPTEAFGVLERRSFAKVKEKLDQDQNVKLEMEEYINYLLLFSEIHDLHYFDGWSGPRGANELQEYFWILRDAAYKVATKNLMTAARGRKEIKIMPTLKLDAPSKSAIHHLINQLREKLNELDIDPAKKDSLLSKLNAFAAEVDRSQTRTAMFFAFFVEASRTVREVSDNIQPFQQTLDRIADIVEKAQGFVTALTGPSLPKQIEGPKTDDTLPTDKG